MIKKAFLGLLGLVMATAMLGLWGHATPTRADPPVPPNGVQPVNPLAIGGFGVTTLGATAVDNVTSTDQARGTRLGLPWIYTGPGFLIDADKDVVDGTDTGSIISSSDTACVSTDENTGISVVSQGPPESPPGAPWYDGVPFRWLESTTIVQGTDDAYLLPLVPPYSWIYRHTAVLDNIWLLGASPIELDPPLMLTTVYTSVPWSVNSGAIAATTRLAGNPVLPSPAFDLGGSSLCADSPQSSISHDFQYANPPLLGDSGGPLTVAADSDATVTGIWSDTGASVVSLGAAANTTLPIDSQVLNNGPVAGTFKYHWDIELTRSDIMSAVWTSNNAAQDDTATVPSPLPVAGQASPTNGLKITCAGTGEGLVVLKGVLFPVHPGTNDPYPDDNVATNVVQVLCNTTADSTPVDKEVIWVKPDTSVAPGGVSDPEHLSLYGSHIQAIIGGPTVAVFLDELKANHETDDVDGKEWLTAETSGSFEAAPTVAWGSTVTVAPGDGSAPYNPTTVITSGSGWTTIAYPATGTISEVPGQTDVRAQLNISCTGVTQGIYSVVVKAIDAPVGEGEKSPKDNAARAVIKVFCWTTAPAGDTVDDATGLYARWTLFTSGGDYRTGFAQPTDPSPGTSMPGDIMPNAVAIEVPEGGKMERTVRLECFWMDANGCQKTGGGSCDTNATPLSGWIDDEESHLDSNLVALGGYDTVDPDHDCVIDAAYAQPNHPVETAASQPGGTCDPIPWSSAPNLISYSKATDNDCDGLVDGVERAWGSNPKLADTDGDGANDFVELAMFTNPVDKDTDSDGYLDKPANTYANDGTGRTLAGALVPTDPTVDNCPSVANPDQANTSGKDRTLGPAVTTHGGKAWGTSNPTQTKMGDACNQDDDIDGLPDGSEAQCGTNAQTVSVPFTCSPGRPSPATNVRCGCWAPYGARTAADSGQDVGAGGVTNVATTLPVTSAAPFNADPVVGQIIKVDNEQMNVVPRPTSPQGKITALISNVQTALPVNTIAPFALGQVLLLEGEEMDVVAPAPSGTTINVLRGQHGTSAQAHLSNRVFSIVAPFIAGQITVERGVWGTTAAAHSAGAEIDILGNTCQYSQCDPKRADTDGDGILDGPEILLNTNPLDAASKPSINTKLTLVQAKLFRACRWNLPDDDAYSGVWDDSFSGGTDAVSRIELDIDGDGVNCDGATLTYADVGTGGIGGATTDKTLPVTDTAPFVAQEKIKIDLEVMTVNAITTPGAPGVLTVTRGTTNRTAHTAGTDIYHNDADSDNDNGPVIFTPKIIPAAAEIPDNLEVEGYFMSATLTDSDGDKCADFIEALDVNGDRAADVSDGTYLSRRGKGTPTTGYEGEVVSDHIADINHDGAVDVSDKTYVDRNACSKHPAFPGCVTGFPCPAEN